MAVHTGTSSRSSVLFATDERDCFVLDIPTSIALAQGTSHSPFDKCLISSSDAIDKQWPSTEPKSEIARANVKANHAKHNDNESVLEETVQRALKVIKDEYVGSWHLPRNRHHIKKHKIDSIQDDSNQHDGPCETSTSNTIAPSSFLASVVVQSQTINSPSPDYRVKTSSPWTSWHSQSYTNSLPRQSNLTLKLPFSSGTSMTFHIPPCSTFVLSTLPPPTLSTTPIPSRGFDLILLDPPWPNRSARRRGAYSTVKSVTQAINMLHGLNLGAYLPATNEGGTVCIWCTNKPSVRAAAISYLADLGLSVVEEWIWIKVTTQGMPVLPIEGIWRKPWEVLLIGQQQPITQTTSKRMDEHQYNPFREAITVRRRVIAAVPDEHSRKPCLKELFETLLCLPAEYEALEVFARNLSAGWHAWGNEVLLLNWEGFWSDLKKPDE